MPRLNKSKNINRNSKLRKTKLRKTNSRKNKIQYGGVKKTKKINNFDCIVESEESILSKILEDRKYHNGLNFFNESAYNPNEYAYFSNLNMSDVLDTNIGDIKINCNYIINSKYQNPKYKTIRELYQIAENSEIENYTNESKLPIKYTINYIYQGG